MIETAIDCYSNKRYHSAIGMVTLAIFIEE